jgi:hypothetical protein
VQIINTAADAATTCPKLEEEEEESLPFDFSSPAEATSAPSADMGQSSTSSDPLEVKR